MGRRGAGRTSIGYIPAQGTMTDTTPTASDRRLVARVLLVVPLLAAIASPVGAWYVTREQVARQGETITGHTGRLAELEAYRAALTPQVAALQAHAADRTLHPTDDTLRVAIERELRPLRDAVSSMQSAGAAQQRQLDRIERLVERLAERQTPNPNR